MATFTASRFSSVQPFQAHASGLLCVAYGTIAVAANPADGDIYQMCKVPAGAVVIGGHIIADDLDTNATETLDMDIGWATNGVDAADPDGLGNLGIWEGNAVADIQPEAINYFLLGGVLKDGPKTFTRETSIQIEANAAAATFAAGDITVYVHYLTP